MSELQDAMKVLQDMRPMLDPADDFMTIASAEEQMGLVAEERFQELDQAHSQLRQLARTLDAARTSSTRPPTVPSEDAHAKELNALDALRLSLAKAINDAEGALASREAELSRLREECASLERRDPAAEHDLDGTALRLAIFKGMGFEPVSDKDGNVEKMLVRSQSGEVHCVSFNDGRPAAEYTQLLWKLAST